MILILSQVLKRNVIVMIERKLKKPLLPIGSTTGNKSVRSKKPGKLKQKLMPMQKLQGCRPKKIRKNKIEKIRKQKIRDWLMKRLLKKKLNVKNESLLKNL